LRVGQRGGGRRSGTDQFGYDTLMFLDGPHPAIIGPWISEADSGELLVRRKVENVITGMAHTGVCVPDCEAAVAFYRDVLGLRVLSPPYVMTGNAIRDDMGELMPDPSMKAAIVGFEGDGDRVLEVIEYLGAPTPDGRAGDRTLTDKGLSHVGLVCEDLDATRAELESKGVRFLVSGIAEVARVRTTWFVDPWGVVFILVEKSRPQRPYYSQWA
jgi:catechol 2,3-dioxygenase-like lactoylglutathione lyase family enzyme